jgi:hypothetical protein
MIQNRTADGSITPVLRLHASQEDLITLDRATTLQPLMPSSIIRNFAIGSPWAGVQQR